MTETPIASAEDLVAGVEALIRIDPRFAAVVSEAGMPEPRIRGGGFESLARIIVSQQLSVGAADAIGKRLYNAGIKSRQDFQSATIEALRNCGLSRQKVEYIKTIAESDTDFGVLAGLSDQKAIRSLCAMRGVGVWTAEIYLMFCLGRQDVLPAGDLALRESTRILLELEERPTERQLREIAVAWSPWRSVAAYLLWKLYRIYKKREGIR